MGTEAEVIDRGRLEAAGIDLDREVLGCGGAALAARHDGGERRVAGQLPLHGNVHLVAGGRGDAGPEHHAVGQRVAAGQAMGEADLGDGWLRRRLAVIAAAAGRERQHGHGAGSPGHLAHKAAAVQVAGFGGGVFEQIVQRRLAGFVGHGAFIADKNASVASVHDVAVKRRTAGAGTVCRHQ
ncbi:hypothetical protein SDC9_164174 [bioreactor metagenome]|uniref:Uncharacterized protein n=1 Tax=bioreactor metagenome TaxID=1076179 RepID=A0A645FQX3_9ZZZZ